MIRPPNSRQIAAFAGMMVVVFLFLRWVSESTPSPEASPSLVVGQTETRYISTSSDSSVAIVNATFNCGRVVMFSESQHPFCRKIVAELRQRLTDNPHIRDLVWVDHPFAITNTDASPDLFLNVDVVSAQHSGGLPSTFHSVVIASLSNTPWFDALVLEGEESGHPSLQLQWRSEVTAISTFVGIRTDRYAKLAREVADKLAKEINEQLQKRSADHPPLPSLPSEFYGPYETVTDFDWMEPLSARRIGSYCGLFTHNETYWRFQTPPNPEPTLEHVAQSLKTAGWKIRSLNITNTGHPRIKASRGDSWLSVFPTRLGREHVSSEDDSQQPREFYIHHRKPFTRVERAEALEPLFTRNLSDPAALLPFIPAFSGDQWPRFLALLEKSGSSSPQGCLELASLFLNQGRTNEAAHQLLRAHALRATLPDSASLKTQITESSEKIWPQQTSKLEFTPEICRELGFIEIEKVTQPMEYTRKFGQPLAFFGPFNNTLSIFAMTVRGPMKYHYSVEHRRAEKGMIGSGAGGFSRLKRGFSEHTLGGGRWAVIVRSEALPDSSGAKFTVRPKRNAESTP